MGDRSRCFLVKGERFGSGQLPNMAASRSLRAHSNEHFGRTIGLEAREHSASDATLTSVLEATLASLRANSGAGLRLPRSAAEAEAIEAAGCSKMSITVAARTRTRDSGINGVASPIFDQ